MGCERSTNMLIVENSTTMCAYASDGGQCNLQLATLSSTLLRRARWPESLSRSSKILVISHAVGRSTFAFLSLIILDQKSHYNTWTAQVLWWIINITHATQLYQCFQILPFQYWKKQVVPFISWYVFNYNIINVWFIRFPKKPFKYFLVYILYLVVILEMWK